MTLELSDHAASSGGIFSRRQEATTMRIRARSRGFGARLALGAALLVLPLAFAPAVSGQANDVRWDIISLATPPLTFNPGGFAEAKAPKSTGTHVLADDSKIRLTGSGTFVLPAQTLRTAIRTISEKYLPNVVRANDREGILKWSTRLAEYVTRLSGAVTGGGTWQTFDAAGGSTGSGTYEVVELVTFEFANFQSQTPVVIDNIGDTNERANGTAVLRIEYSDGSRGVLTVGCHGPGAPDGIVEGISVTKGFATYDLVQTPLPGVDANRTLFHVNG